MENKNFNNEVQNGNNCEPMTLGDWLITYLLLLIPIANIILMFVWAFGKNVKQSKKTYFQASLILSAVGIVLCIVFFGAIAAFLSETGNF